MKLTDKQRKAKKQAIGFFAEAMQIAAAGPAPAEEPARARPNFVGAGIGPKVVNGATIVEDEAVRILVRAKVPKSQLPSEQLLPDEFNGLPTDVVEVGDMRLLHHLKTWQRFGRHRPTDCGVSVGHPNVTAGTIGCLVEKDGDRYILSNNHILADLNRAAIGDDIIQPGRVDGGSPPGDNIAVLADYEPLAFGGPDNEFDAAIARLNRRGDAERFVIEIGALPATTKAAARYQSVRKHGRTTGHTVGVVMTVGLDLWLNSGASGLAWFVDQMQIVGVGGQQFADGGDSGSLVVDAVTREPVGLLCAAGTTSAVASPIDKVLSRFNVSIV